MHSSCCLFCFGFVLFGWLVVLVVVGWLLLFFFLDSSSHTVFWIKQQKPLTMFNVCFFLVKINIQPTSPKSKEYSKTLTSKRTMWWKESSKNHQPPKKSTPLQALKLTTRLNQLSFFFPLAVDRLPLWNGRIAWTFRSWKGRNSKVDPQIFGGVDRWWIPKTPFPIDGIHGMRLVDLPTWIPLSWYIYLHGTDIFTHMGLVELYGCSC